MKYTIILSKSCILLSFTPKITLNVSLLVHGVNYVSLFNATNEKSSVSLPLFWNALRLTVENDLISC